jgi:exopolysaccharide biosynthesis polyprenyl glycosylphosphotransferase
MWGGRDIKSGSHFRQPADLVTVGHRNRNARSTGSEWRAEYSRRLAVTDLLALAFATAIATIWRFGLESSEATTGRSSVSYVVVSLFVIASWWLALTYFNSRDHKIVGEGPDEYRRLFHATFVVFGWVAIASLLTKFDLSRGYLALTFPIGLSTLAVSRKLWRNWLTRQRRRSRHVSQVLVIGGARSARRITETLDANPHSGYRVTGVWVPDRSGAHDEWLDVEGRSVPVLGTDRTLSGALETTGADAVIVTDTEHLGHDGVRSLAWDLEDMNIDLMVSPNVIDVSGPRIHVRAVAGMPLIHLEEPQYANAARLGKTAFDLSVAYVMILALSPLLVAAALGVKLTSPGPVLYRSQRIGVGGTPFSMLKFRTMHLNADLQIDRLRASSEGAGPMFKMRNDPRVTPVGKVLRRYSIDELPQLFNVVRGDMSLVGPRPPLPIEVSTYEGYAAKRLLVRQGITGLWQVSGRSNLSWEETVRLDLDYVENWSMVRDLQIIWRTIRAVLAKDGAY